MFPKVQAELAAELRERERETQVDVEDGGRFAELQGTKGGERERERTELNHS